MIMRPGYRLKRPLDVVGSLVLLVLLGPVLMVCGMLVLLDGHRGSVFSDGPLRVGLGGRKFFMYKFRTMVPRAHVLLHTDRGLRKIRDRQKQNGKLSIREDPRITAVGKILRSIDLDELPQLFNVLKGDMSLVGPRPYMQEEIDRHAQDEELRKQFAILLRVKPGMTGLWQVSGRNDIPSRKRPGVDARYVRICSLLSDVKILLRTPVVVLTRTGAW